MILLKKFTYFFLFSTILWSCSSAPYLKTNSRDLFNLEPNTSFNIISEKDLLPAKVDPIFVDYIKEAILINLSNKGHNFEGSSTIQLHIIVSTEDKLDNDLSFYSSPYYYRYPYDYDRIRSIEEFYLRLSIIDTELDKTLWTGLTRWRPSSKFEPNNPDRAQLLVDLILNTL